MTDKLKISVCETLERELKTVVDAENLHDVDVITTPMRCGFACVSASLSGKGKVAYPGRRDPDEKTCRAALIHAPTQSETRCFDLVTNKNIVDEYIQAGTYLLTPGWLAHWRTHVEKWGFDVVLAREFFAETTNKLVLLDTGIDDVSLDRLEEFAEYADRPYEVLPVGLSVFREFVMRIVLEWRLQIAEDGLRKLSKKVTRYSADDILVFDLIERIAGIVDEQEAVEKVLDGYSMLFAPDKLLYVSLVEGRPGIQVARPQRAIEPDDLNRVVGIVESWAWTGSGNGFIIRLEHRDVPLGIIEVDEIAFPERKDHYLNLALATSKVIALALAKIRAYQHLEQVEILKRYRLLSENSRDILLFIREGDGKIIEANEAAVQAYGYSREELLTLDINDIREPKTRSDVRQQMARAGSGGILFETLHCRKDGTCFPVEVSSRGTYIGDEHVLLSIIRDITERKETEDTLKELARLSEARNRINEAITSTLDIDEIMRRVLIEGSEALGADIANVYMHEYPYWIRKYTHGAEKPEQVIGQRVPSSEAKTMELAAEENRPITVSDTSQSFIHIPLSIRESAMGVISYSYLSRSVNFTEAQIDFATKVGATVSLALENARLFEEQRKAAADIRESRRQVLDILESITDGFFALDSLWRFTYINGRAQQLLDMRKEDTLFKTLWDQLPNPQVLSLYKELHLAVEQRAARSFEEYLPSIDKRFEFHVYPYEHGLSVYFSDISDKKV